MSRAFDIAEAGISQCRTASLSSEAAAQWRARERQKWAGTSIGSTLRTQYERIVERQQLGFEEQQPFEANVLDKPLNGNARRGAYLYFNSYSHSSRENGARVSVTSIKSLASISGMALMPKREVIGH